MLEAGPDAFAMRAELDDVDQCRAAVRAGRLRASRLVDWIEASSTHRREGRVDRLLGTNVAPAPAAAPEPDLIGHHGSGVESVLQLIRDVPIRKDDVVVDVGSGLGKVTLLVHLVTGARAIGVERDRALVARAEQLAMGLGANGVSYVLGDARESLPLGTVYYLYLPARGAALRAMIDRVESVTRGRSATVCTLGVDLVGCPWLTSRPSHGFWTAIYERFA